MEEGRTLLVGAQTRLGAFVVELGQDGMGGVRLVRYFKGYEQIDGVEMRKGMLLVQSRWKMDLYPVGRDPRGIHRLHNGYSLTQQLPIRGYHRIDNERFLVVMQDILQIAKMELTDSQV